MATGTYGIEEPVGETFTDYADIAFIAEMCIRDRHINGWILNK